MREIKQCRENESSLEPQLSALSLADPYRSPPTRRVYILCEVLNICMELTFQKVSNH